MKKPLKLLRSSNLKFITPSKCNVWVGTQFSTVSINMSRITRTILPGLLLMLFLPACSKKTEDQEKKSLPQNDSVTAKPKTKEAALSYKKYKGAWFEVEYPFSFKAENSQKSSTSIEGFDSAVFTSADGSVQFYIFSPQWSGEAKDIALKPNEIKADSSSQILNGLTVKRWTIQAKDSSYFRSYESTSETEGNINKIFGIKYSSPRELEKYRQAYLHFKNSLQQYAD